MELFAFGILAGVVLTLIMIGGYYVIFDKGELNEYRSSNSDNTKSCGNSGGNDRRYKELALLEHAKRIGVKLGG